MNFPLLTLPEKALKSVLQKTSYKALSQLRKSNKEIDSFVENNRSQINVFVDGKEYVPYSFQPKHVLVINFYVFTQDLCFTIKNIENREYEVTPESLSGYYFDKIVITIRQDDTRIPWGVPWRYNRQKKYSLIEFKDLRLSCGHSIINSDGRVVAEENLEKLLSKFECARIELWQGWIPLRFLSNPVLQGCSTVSAYSMWDYNIPSDICSILQHARMEELDVCFPKSFVHTVLEALKSDSSDFGSIERFCFQGAYNFDLDCISQYAIWKGNLATHISTNPASMTNNDPSTWEFHPVKVKCCFYIIEVNDGIVLMIKNHNLHIHLIKENIRENVAFYLLEVLMKYTPCDYSSVFEEFVTTDDLSGTIEKFMKGFQADYMYEPSA